MGESHAARPAMRVHARTQRPVFYDPSGRRRWWMITAGLLVTMFTIAVLACVGLVLSSDSTGYQYHPARHTTVGVVR